MAKKIIKQNRIKKIELVFTNDAPEERASYELGIRGVKTITEHSAYFVIGYDDQSNTAYRNDKVFSFTFSLEEYETEVDVPDTPVEETPQISPARTRKDRRAARSKK